MKECEHEGCAEKVAYGIQFHDPWDFFFSCVNHLGDLIHKEMLAQEPDRPDGTFLIYRVKL